MKGPYSSLSTALLALVVLSGCEKEKNDVVDTTLSSPFILSVTSSDSIINLDTATEPTVLRLPSGKYRITDSITARIADVQGNQNIERVTYRLFRPKETEHFQSGTLHRVDEIPGLFREYSARFSFIVDSFEVGDFKIEVVATARSGTTSNSVQKRILITRNNAKPRTSNAVAPDTIVRPMTGTTLILFTVSVSDSDGFNDIEEVFFKRILPSERDPVLMFDDGDQQVTGDRLLGDGIFSRIVRIDSTAFLGEQVFQFEAIDRLGALSDPLLHTITIIP